MSASVMERSEMIRVSEITAARSPSRPFRIENSSSLIKGVKVLGFDSKNGRRYERSAVRESLHLYEGIVVNIDHGTRSDEPRSYQDRFGRLINVRLEADGLYADLSFNPKHILAEQFIWDATHDPAKLGLSHNVQASGVRRNGTMQIESIAKVISVDLVSDPATTSGLFESFTADRSTRSKEYSNRERFAERAAGYRAPRTSAEFAESISSYVTPENARRSALAFAREVCGYRSPEEIKEAARDFAARITD